MPRILLFTCCALLAAFAATAQYAHIPETISEEAKALLRTFPDPALSPPVPAADDIEGWRQTRDTMNAGFVPIAAQIRATAAVDFKETTLGGVPVLDIRPKNGKDNGQVIVYIHGGAFTLFNAQLSLALPVPLAEETGLRVVSIDYTLAPEAKWPAITDQCVAVLKALKEDGHDLGNVAVTGDSAGGALAAGIVLKARDEGVGMPGAVVLFSPWADITETGDSYHTLKAAEPLYTYAGLLKPSADAYAAPEDQKHPYVSPVYGDYTKGFPPTLIQGGTKELFLSNFVRLYQAIDTAGQTVKLDLYEGMPHVFQVLNPAMPESKLARKKVKDFLATHLASEQQ